MDRVNLSTPHLRPCGAGERYLAIDPDGQIAGCQMALDEPITTIFALDPFGELLAANAAKKNPPVTEKNGCRTCQWRFWCAGGCPLIAYRYTGRYNEKSPYCDVYQTLIKEVLRLEAIQSLKMRDEIKLV